MDHVPTINRPDGRGSAGDENAGSRSMAIQYLVTYRQREWTSLRKGEDFVGLGTDLLAQRLVASDMAFCTNEGGPRRVYVCRARGGLQAYIPGVSIERSCQGKLHMADWRTAPAQGHHHPVCGRVLAGSQPLLLRQATERHLRLVTATSC
jgi:hypothetical protein